MASEEVRDAIGEAPTAAERLKAKRAELQQAQAALEAAELAYDIPRTVELQNTVAVLTKFIARLEAAAAVEAATEARADAVYLHGRLCDQYTQALAALAPHLERARKAITATTAVAGECTTTWAAAARVWYEVRVLEMRFNLSAGDLAILPAAPVAALTEMFGDEVERSARLCVRQPLPVYLSVAGDSLEQIAANKMVAAHRDVTAMGKDLHLSDELLALFAKAGTPERTRVQPAADPAVIGTSSLPPGAWQGALGPTSPPPVPETPKEKAERAEIRRRNTRRQAAAAREVGEEAQRIAREDELIQQGKLKGPLDQGLRG